MLLENTDVFVLEARLGTVGGMEGDISVDDLKLDIGASACPQRPSFLRVPFRCGFETIDAEFCGFSPNTSERTDTEWRVGQSTENNLAQMPSALLQRLGFS